MRKLIFNNFGLKILALILALFVWLLVVNINDPKITRTITGVPVTVSNASYVESQGLSSKLGDTSETVSVTVIGNRSDVEKITKDNITVTADLTQIINMEAEPIMVPVTAEIAGISADSISVNPSTVEVALEPMKNESFIVLATAGDTHPSSNGLEIGELIPSIETVNIVGPESLINIIDRVVAQVDVSSVRSDTTISSDLKIFDKNGSEFSETAMNNLKFLNSERTIDVNVDFWSVVSDVKISVVPRGDVAEGYRIDRVSTTPEVLSLAGSDDAIVKLMENGNTITVDGEDVDVSGMDSDFSGRIDITGYLPENMKLSENVSPTVIVSIEIEPLGSVNFDIPTSDITQKNLAQGLGVIYNVEDIKISVQGSEEDLGKITAASLNTTIDFSGMTEGDYDDVKVNVTLPENCWLVSSEPVSLEIFKADADSTVNKQST